MKIKKKKKKEQKVQRVNYLLKRNKFLIETLVTKVLKLFEIFNA